VNAKNPTKYLVHNRPNKTCEQWMVWGASVHVVCACVLRTSRAGSTPASLWTNAAWCERHPEHTAQCCAFGAQYCAGYAHYHVSEPSPYQPASCAVRTKSGHCSGACGWLCPARVSRPWRATLGNNLDVFQERKTTVGNSWTKMAPTGTASAVASCSKIRGGSSVEYKYTNCHVCCGVDLALHACDSNASRKARDVGVISNTALMGEGHRGMKLSSCTLLIRSTHDLPDEGGNFGVGERKQLARGVLLLQNDKWLILEQERGQEGNRCQRTTSGLSAVHTPGVRAEWQAVAPCSTNGTRHQPLRGWQRVWHPQKTTIPQWKPQTHVPTQTTTTRGSEVGGQGPRGCPVKRYSTAGECCPHMYMPHPTVAAKSHAPQGLERPK